MIIRIKIKPKLAKKWSVYVRNDWQEQDALINGITIALPFIYVFIFKKY